MLSRHTAEQMCKYAVYGLLNSCLSYSVFFALYRLVGVHYVPASALGYSAGIVNSFLLNRAYTFKATGPVQPMVFRFALVTAYGIGTNLTSLHLLVTVFRLAPEVCPGSCVVLFG